MPAEIRGQNLRIRMEDPTKYSEFRVEDVGSPGKLQIIIGKFKRTDNWGIQSYRVNLDDYSNVNEVISEIKKLKTLTGKQKAEAIKLAREYFK
jgi:hypothetical protein